MSEEERAELFRWQQQQRAIQAYRLWRSMSGDAARRRQLDVNWEPLLPEPGWDRIEYLTRAERDTINS
jgi:hypothetical protein